jgi:hypothetical protein
VTGANAEFERSVTCWGFAILLPFDVAVRQYPPGVSTPAVAPKPPLGERFRAALLKPVEPSVADVSSDPMNHEELREAASSMTDKERLIGLVAAPVAAFLTFVVTAALVSNDPAEHLKSGRLNPAHVSVSMYHSLEIVLLGVSLTILLASMMRKRLVAGIATALFGLGIFNLHYWGFGVPFVMVGAWLLVRSYRLQQQLKLAAADAAAAASAPARRRSSAARTSSARATATSARSPEGTR